MTLHSSGLFRVWTASGCIDHLQMVCFAFGADAKVLAFGATIHFVRHSKFHLVFWTLPGYFTEAGMILNSAMEVSAWPSNPASATKRRNLPVCAFWKRTFLSLLPFWKVPAALGLPRFLPSVLTYT